MPNQKKRKRSMKNHIEYAEKFQKTEVDDLEEIVISLEKRFDKQFIII